MPTWVKRLWKLITPLIFRYPDVPTPLCVPPNYVPRHQKLTFAGKSWGRLCKTFSIFMAISIVFPKSVGPHLWTIMAKSRCRTFQHVYKIWSDGESSMMPKEYARRQVFILLHSYSLTAFNCIFFGAKGGGGSAWEMSEVSGVKIDVFAYLQG